jgi:iron complex outermembrane receptor protein
LEYTPKKDPLLSVTTNCKTCEHSNWTQEQVFIDFDWTPLDNLKISPGFKYVNFRREINAAEDTLTVNGASTIGPIRGTNTYDSPLYFLTGNYKILPVWSVYAQFATSFLIPQLSDLQVPGVNLQHLQPETTVTYQTGTVYSHGSITADADVYLIDAANTNVSCTIPDPSGGFDAATCNAGKVVYSGFEGEGAYALRFGLTLFVNGSINNARQQAQAANVASGIAGNPDQELANVPESTAAVGGLYAHGPWQASLTFKEVGGEVVYGATTSAQPSGVQIRLPSYNTMNAAVDYNFGAFQIKLQGFNLLDKRTLTTYTPSGSETGLYQTNGGEYTFQSGREVQLTLAAKF